MRKELRDVEKLLSKKMEATLIPLRSQVEKALEEPPRLASCAYQGAWNTTGTVTYSDVQLDQIICWEGLTLSLRISALSSSTFSFCLDVISVI